MKEGEFEVVKHPMIDQNLKSGCNELKKMNRIFIYSNGCQRRNLEAQKTYTYLLKNDFEVVDDPEDANYIIFFTCGFLDGVAEVSFDLINKFQIYNAELIVAGCIPEIKKERLQKIFNGKVLSPKEMYKIDSIFENNKIKYSEVADSNEMWQNNTLIGSSPGVFESIITSLQKISIAKKFIEWCQYILSNRLGGHTVPYFNKFRSPKESHYFIKISQGCIHNCSYCGIRNAVGPLKSKPVDQCIKEFEEGLQSGYKKFSLQADDVGPYGIDIASSLPELLDKMTILSGTYELYIENTHPGWLIKYQNQWTEIISRRNIKAIIVSLQSGSNRILKLMRRAYTKEEVSELLINFKELNSNLKILTEIIVGFPSETREEFMETLDFIEEIHFDAGSILAFSPVKGTDAATMTPVITQKEMQTRLKLALNYLRKKGYYAWYTKNLGKITFHTKEYLRRAL